jgi:Mrp family chromosome partitioning ATPase
MEKLQKALRQAREHRERGPGTDRKTPAAPRPANDAEVDAVEGAWAAIEKRVPDPRQMLDRLLVSQQAQQMATPFDILRTKTQLLMRKNDWTRLAITSPTAACGKTTIASNLALGFGRQTDLRVILLEMDLRRPSLTRVLGMRPEHDITDVMSGKVDFARQAIRLSDNVAVSMARQPAPDPTTIFLRQQTREVLSEIERVYRPDIVLFDLPPLLAGDDTRAFLKEVDCALIVARAGSSSVSQIDVCEREVSEQTNVLGVVLNQCRYASDEGYDGYSYGS